MGDDHHAAAQCVVELAAMVIHFNPELMCGGVVNDVHVAAAPFGGSPAQPYSLSARTSAKLQSRTSSPFSQIVSIASSQLGPDVAAPPSTAPSGSATVLKVPYSRCRASVK